MATPSELRQHIRIACDIGAQLDYGDEQLPATVTNLSAGGAFVETVKPLKFSAQLSLLIELPGIDEPCELFAVVRWTNYGNGAGIQFVMIPKDKLAALDRLLDQLIGAA